MAPMRFLPFLAALALDSALPSPSGPIGEDFWDGPETAPIEELESPDTEEVGEAGSSMPSLEEPGWLDADSSDRAHMDPLMEEQSSDPSETRSARRLAGGVVKKTVFPIEVLAGGNRQGADLRQLWQPYGVARDTSTGETYVADMMNHRIQRWTDGGSPETVFGGTFGGGLDQLKYPRGLALLSGSLYIADSGNHRVLRWDVSGGSSAVVVAGEWGVLYDRQNQVRANDASCCRGGSGVNQLRDPHGVFVDGSGDIYVAEQRISGVK